MNIKTRLFGVLVASVLVLAGVVQAQDGQSWFDVRPVLRRCCQQDNTPSVQFYNFYDSDGDYVSGTAISTGTSTFYNFYDSDGDYTSGSSYRTGQVTFYNFYDSDGDYSFGSTYDSDGWDRCLGLWGSELDVWPVTEW